MHMAISTASYSFSSSVPHSLL